MKIVGHVSGSELLKGFDTVRKIIELDIGVELQLTSKILDSFTLKEYGKLRKLAQTKPITVHAPFLDLNPGATDRYVLEATRKRFEETLIAAKVLEAEVIVFHTGFHPAKIYPIYDTWLKTAIETFRYIAERSSCKIALENVFDEVPDHLERLLKELPENVGVCIDIGHLNLFSEKPIELWIEKFKGRIFEFHIHDNNGKKDEHTVVGNGTFDFDTFFKLLEKIPNSYIFNLENKRPEDVEESLRRILDD
ncbi:Xylose isomerase domain-containing protein TIM barrel [Desulfurobacterium thermolithotrophum DSM 11699]|uniref:Xylose isomerase domain-containing protein TIM barrel n=1 Tax=Desulfurobacterium thermolithotrophum (strain DSM 11699 / BSA) TaxID=868864 RepID=F0S2P6_DESTD|nr:sugar phosphate isomerase/epimerase [Desulfurobacterium thermolithotrophum]ADY73118.1 Xylose isomerase domain-containing protein TIM barrel [Desulfurobacterium thermolithotrophum DSM 11699]